MALVVEEDRGKYLARKGVLVSEEKFHYLLNPLRMRILSELSKAPSYPTKLAEKLRIPEQKVFYHMRALKAGGFVRVEKREERRGGIANYFSAAGTAFAVKLPGGKDFALSLKSKGGARNVPEMFEGFVGKEGDFDGLLVVGSPDSHGPNRARARDGHYSGEMASVISRFASIGRPIVRTDTELRESERKENLILLGGPITNMLVGLVNESLPIRFEREHNWDILSERSGKYYSEEDCGIVARTKNPWNPEKEILVVAGKRFSGTRSALLALLSMGERVRSAKSGLVVEGIDLNGDGIVDASEIKEAF